jgi:FAH family protein
MKLICIGKNYAPTEGDTREKPANIVVFSKPDTAIHNPELPYYIPDFTQELFYEAELILKISQNAKCVAEKFAHKYYDEIGLGIDFTACDIQRELMANGRSWELSKAFDGSAVVGKFIRKEELPDLHSVRFHLQKNGQTVQQGDSALMYWHFDAIIAEVTKYFTLRKGDLIFTGTPAGAAAVTPGDVLEGFLGNESCFKLRVK